MPKKGIEVEYIINYSVVVYLKQYRVATANVLLYTL